MEKATDEKEYINKGIKFMEELPPSKMNPALWTIIKTKYLPRLKAYINKETVVDIDYETAKEVMTGIIEEEET